MRIARVMLLGCLSAGLVLAHEDHRCCSEAAAVESSKEVVLKGSVFELSRHTCEHCNGVRLDMVLKTDSGEKVDVALGPDSFFKERDFLISTGDIIELRAVRTQQGHYIAHWVKKAGEHLLLRSEMGKAAWAAHYGPCCASCSH